jgi:hypothetical protein
MVDPGGAEHWGRLDLCEIDPVDRCTARDAFSDPSGVSNTDMPIATCLSRKRAIKAGGPFRFRGEPEPRSQVVPRQRERKRQRPGLERKRPPTREKPFCVSCQPGPAPRSEPGDHVDRVAFFEGQVGHFHLRPPSGPAASFRPVYRSEDLGFPQPDHEGHVADRQRLLGEPGTFDHFEKTLVFPLTPAGIAEVFVEEQDGAVDETVFEFAKDGDGRGVQIAIDVVIGGRAVVLGLPCRDGPVEPAFDQVTFAGTLGRLPPRSKSPLILPEPPESSGRPSRLSNPQNRISGCNFADFRIVRPVCTPNSRKCPSAPARSTANFRVS